MIKNVIAGCVLLLLSACADQSGFEIVDKYTLVGNRTATIHHSDYATLNTVCGSSALACWMLVDGVHHIYIPPPQGPDDVRYLCLLYHELLHVEIGRWHGRQYSTDCTDEKFYGVR